MHITTSPERMNPRPRMSVPRGLLAGITDALAVAWGQRFTINPLMRLLLRIGVNPLGVAILETRGRRSGQPRRTPVGNGRTGTTFWIIAEHGTHAGYVRNLRH
jgi:F420H(2)-dependent quinone reductase